MYRTSFQRYGVVLFLHLLVAAKEAEGEKRKFYLNRLLLVIIGKVALEVTSRDIPGTYISGIFNLTDAVSPMQAEQMQKQEGTNVNVTAIHGATLTMRNNSETSLVDVQLRRGLLKRVRRFSSANSINIGYRLAPRVYCVNALLNLLHKVNP